MNKTIELQAADFAANTSAHLQSVLGGTTITVVVNGQRMLHLSTTRPEGLTYTLDAMDFGCAVGDYALLVAVHGRNYRVPFVAGAVFVTRAPGYYEEFLDRWASEWASPSDF